MPITAADIRREVKEKNVTFIRLMFSDILGTMKNVEIPAHALASTPILVSSLTVKRRSGSDSVLAHANSIANSGSVHFGG